MSIEDFDDLEDTLGIDDNTSDLDRGNEYSPEELLTDTFVQTHTEFGSASDFLETLPDYQEVDGYLECDEVQAVVDQQTDFDDFSDMLDEAAVDQVESTLDL